MNYCNCPNCQTVNCPAALNEAESGASVRSSELVRRLEAENVMLKNYNGQLNTMLDAWYAAFGTNQLTHALARLEAAEKRAAKSSSDKSSHSRE